MDFVLSLRIAVGLIIALCAPGVITAAQAADLAVIGAKIYTSPTARPIENGVVVIRGGRVVAVGSASKVKPPAGATIIDGHGRAVTAGFWNNHVHIFTHDLLHADRRSAAELSRTLGKVLNRWGFTTVFDVASILANTNVIRERIRTGEVQGPNILTVGEPFYPPGGTPIYVRQFLKNEHIKSPEVTSIPEALAREKDEIGHGADGVKLFTGAIVGGDVGVLPMPLPLATALVKQARQYRKPVFAHPSNAQGVEIAIDSGVDVLAHTAPMMGPWNPAFVKKLLGNRMALIPTLTLFEVEAKKFGESPADEAGDIATAIQQLHAYWSAGGDILFGTDVGYTEAYDTTEEYRLMSRAGLDYRAILASLTTTPAKHFGYSDRKGRIAPGMDADLVVLDADPASDVTAFARVHNTIRGGKVIYDPEARVD